MRARIAAIEYALPEQRVTNADLAAAHPDWDMSRIAEQTGVLERRVCAPDETALDLGLRASEALLQRTRLAPTDVDGLIVCTQTPDYLLPPNSCILQERLKLSTAIPAFDLSHACSGYVYGLFIANALIVSGAAHSILLVTSDSYSRRLHPDDRSTIPLFGDAGAATLVVASDDARAGLDGFSMGTDGAGAGAFILRAGGARAPRADETGNTFTTPAGSLRSADHIAMDGPAVLGLVRRRIPDAVRELLERAKRTMEDVDLVIFHQASAVALDYLDGWFALPAERRFRNLSHIGNTVSASVPIALRDAERAGRLRQGMRVLVVGFGVGFSWGTCLIDW